MSIQGGPIPPLTGQPIVPLPVAPEDYPSLEHVVTEDDTPVENVFSERQMQLLKEALYSSWEGPGEGRTWLAMANVGVFSSPYLAPIVPDVLLSLDVAMPTNPRPKEDRSYFLWIYGKAPDVVFEIVSNTKGKEADSKLRDYARLGIPYYVIYDPLNTLGDGLLRIYCLQGRRYRLTDSTWLDDVGLGLTIWHGVYEDMKRDWLRWCTKAGALIPTGAERADQEKQRADRLAAKLRELGVDPNL